MAFSRILIVKLSSLGDVIHSLPVAGAVRRRFPDAEISWLVGPASASVVGMCRHVDRVVVWEPGRRSRLALASDLRGVHARVALDMQGLLRTAGLAWLSGARWRIGFRSFQEGGFVLCNLRVVPPRTDIHAVDAYREFGRRLGADDGSPDFGLAVPRWAQRRAAALVPAGRGGRRIALLPGTRWPTKKWPARHFAALARDLDELGAQSVVLGDRDDRLDGSTIASAAPHSAVDLTGRTSLVESAAVIAHCDLAVGNDSGSMHLAAALGTPVVALFGPTDPVRTGPYGAGHAVLEAPVPCVRCRRRRCRFPCMEKLRPEIVLQAVRTRLGW